MLKKFENNEQAVIVNTATNLDGVRVIVTGDVYNGPEFYFHVIERCDGELWHNGYKSSLMIASCLCKVSEAT